MNAGDAAIGKSPLAFNGCGHDPFRNKMPPRQLDRWHPNHRGQITMTDRDPFAEGERAARDNIPAEANPYSNGSDEHALWSAGHEKVAGDMEARESEGS
jgi:hypothetical protein